MKLRITGCSRKEFWYLGLVGETFNVVDYQEGVGSTVDFEGNTDQYKAFVLVEDCIVYEDYNQEKIDKAFNRLKKDLLKIVKGDVNIG